MFADLLIHVNDLNSDKFVRIGEILGILGIGQITNIPGTCAQFWDFVTSLNNNSAFIPPFYRDHSADTEPSSYDYYFVLTGMWS